MCSPSKSCILFGSDTDRNHHDTKFSIPVPILSQSSWKSCIFLYLGYTVLLPSSFAGLSCTAFTHEEEPACLNIFQCVILWSRYYYYIPPHSPTIFIAEIVYKMHVSMFFICKRRNTGLNSIRTRSRHVTTLQARFSNT